jgi:AcrR family transcriptional regulator
LAREVDGTVERRVDPRVKRTRELIVGAFNDLVAEKGHTGLTVQEIAERATMNRATFYAHFTDQYELLDYYISESFREELRRRLPDSPGLSRENLKALVLAACEFLSKLETNCRRSDRQFRPLIEARVQGELYELLLGWVEASPERAGGWSVDPEVVASVVSWSIFGAALDWSRNGTVPSPEEVADRVLSVIVEGLRLT